MPRSSIRRKVEKSISLALFKLASIANSPHFRPPANSSRPKENENLKPTESQDAPQGLYQFDTKIGVFCEETYLKSAILHLLPNSTFFATMERLYLTTSAGHRLDGLLCILTTHSDLKRIEKPVSESKLPVAVYLLDRENNQLLPVLGETDSNAIPIGIFPLKHNPAQGFPWEENNPKTSSSRNNCILTNRMFQRLRSSLSVEGTVTSGRLNSETRPLELNPLGSINKYADNLIKSYLARGVRLQANYSNSLFNAYPSIDFIVDGVPTHRESQYSRAWNSYVTSASIPEVYDGGTIYDGLATVFSVLTSQSSLRYAWKSRVLIVCDNCPNGFISEITHQSNIDVYLCTTQQATALGEDAIRGRFDYITRMSPDRVYPPGYLQSKLTVFKYTTAEFVSEPELATQCPHSPVVNATQPLSTVSSTSTKNCLEFFTLSSAQLLGKGFTDSGYGTEYFSKLKSSLANAKQQRLKLSVVIPVFNNGQYLAGKALPSLLRNQSWGSMEIILVDDGSTDPKTIALCTFLARIFPNCRVFKFPQGGSGSASRARNKGIQMATCDALTFLDPDNEINDRGYDKLLRKFISSNSGGRTCDFVSGYQVKVASTISINARQSFAPWPTKIKSPRREFFELGSFPTVSTQAAIMNRRVLIDKKIEFVPNAVGQDTLFGWEVLLAAKNPIFTNAAYILYYSERANSVTNSVDAYYFKKCLRKETAQVKWLQDNNLLESYTANKLNYFIERWYKVKLEQVPNDQRRNAEKYLNQIVLLYENAMSNRTRRQ